VICLLFECLPIVHHRRPWCKIYCFRNRRITNFSLKDEGRANWSKMLKEVFHDLARQKECLIIEGNLVRDHVPMCIEIPPKHAVASVIRFLKGKGALAVARRVQQKDRNFSGEQSWARGYMVSTVEFEMLAVRRYIREQEQADQEGRF